MTIAPGPKSGANRPARSGLAIPRYPASKQLVLDGRLGPPAGKSVQQWQQCLVLRRLTPVTDAARNIFDQALSLADEDRLRLAEALFDSLSTDAQEQIDRAWREELVRRMGQVRRGEVELESWEDVRRAGREALAR